MDVDEVAKILALGKAAEFVVNHPKFEGISQLAAWLWLRGLVYTMTHQTVGVVSEAAVKTLAPGATGRRRAEILVTAGLWRVVPGGWKMRALSAAPPPSAPLAPALPVGKEVLRYETVGSGPGYWPLTETQVETWRKVYPSIEVLAECGYAQAWLGADKSRRKTNRGMPRFLVAWLTRATDRRRAHEGQSLGTTRGRTGAAPDGKYENVKVSDED